MLEGENAPSATAKLLIRHKTVPGQVVSEVEKVALVIFIENFYEREPRHQRDAHRQQDEALAPHQPSAASRPQVLAEQSTEEPAVSVQKVS